MNKIPVIIIFKAFDTTIPNSLNPTERKSEHLIRSPIIQVTEWTPPATDARTSENANAIMRSAFAAQSPTAHSPVSNISFLKKFSDAGKRLRIGGED